MARSTPNKLNPLLFQKPLLQWYDRNKRDLPWRGIHNPYATFVSEMMLQQTQVKTVIPYYHRFLKELPDWKSLAKAKEEKVLKLWEGLGYYRRARNLQAAAQMVVKRFKGQLPEIMEDILELPGVGPYSAGAVLSIAFQKPHPVVDGNVIRVFSRLFLLRGNLKSGEGQKKVWELAQTLLSQDRPGDFNQAFMELGATLCFPDNPQCLLCPLLSLCQAAKMGVQQELPEMTKAPKAVKVPMAAVLVEKDGKFLVKHRSKDEKWLKDFWEFPSSEGDNFEDALNQLEKSLKIRAFRDQFHEVRHQITHHKIQLRLFKSHPWKNTLLPKGYRWVDRQELTALPFASAQGKLRKKVLSSPPASSSSLPLKAK